MFFPLFCLAAATMISYESLPSAIGATSHHMHQPMPASGGHGIPQQQHTQPPHQTMQQQQQLQHPHQQQMFGQQQQQQAFSASTASAGGGGLSDTNTNTTGEFELDASSSEEIWDLDSNTVKRYNNAAANPVGGPQGGVPGSMGGYGDSGGPGGGGHFTASNVMWGNPMYPHHPGQHGGGGGGFPAGSADMYGNHGTPGGNPGDWMNPNGPPVGGGGLKRPASNHSGQSNEDVKRIKTYQCEACDKWFTSSGHLKRHFNTTLHKNATRQQQQQQHVNPKAGSPRLIPGGPPGAASAPPPNSRLTATPEGAPPPSMNSISSNSTSTLNSSPSPSSPHPSLNSNSTTSAMSNHPSVTSPGGGGGGPPNNNNNNNVPNSPSPRGSSATSGFYSNSSRTSPMTSVASPAKMHPGGGGGMMGHAGSPMAPGQQILSPPPPPPSGMGGASPMRPLPSMKDSSSLSHINSNSNSSSSSSDLVDPATGLKPSEQQQLYQMQQQQQQQQQQMLAVSRSYGHHSNLYSPDSVSAVSRVPAAYPGHPGAHPGGHPGGDPMVGGTTDFGGGMGGVAPSDMYSPSAFSYHGHYSTSMTDYSHTNGGGGAGYTPSGMMYQAAPPMSAPGPGGRYGDIGYVPPSVSEGGGSSVKDDLDQLSVATADLEEGMSEAAGTPATPTDSLEGGVGGGGPPTPNLATPPNVSGPNSMGEYRCNECNKVFNRLCYLKQHNKTFHNGEKPFKCGQCGKRFPVEVLYQVRHHYCFIF